MVNEIGVDGEVVVLRETKYENPASQQQKKQKSQKTEQVPVQKRRYLSYSMLTIEFTTT